MNIQRRRFIKLSSGLLAFGSLPLPIKAISQTSTNNKIVSIFLRFASDGVHIVTPTKSAFDADSLKFFKYIRGGIELNGSKKSSFLNINDADEITHLRPSSPKNSTINGYKLKINNRSELPSINDNKYMLHPLLTGFRDLYMKNELAILYGVGGVGSTSHFDAQDAMEWSVPHASGSAGEKSGWLHDAMTANGSSTALTGISFGTRKFEALSGLESSSKVLTVSKLSDFQNNDLALKSLFDTAYDDSKQAGFSNSKATGRDMVNAIEKIGGINVQPGLPDYNSPDGSAYTISTQLHQAAALLKANIGIESIAVNGNLDWDTHDNEINRLEITLDGLNKLLSGFVAELKRDGTWESTTILLMSEFGRTVDTNGNMGTDHGHGSVAFVLSGAANFNGGEIYGTDSLVWPKNMEDPAWKNGNRLYLPNQIDYRIIYREILSKCYGWNKTSSQIQSCLKASSAELDALPGSNLSLWS